MKKLVLIYPLVIALIISGCASNDTKSVHAHDPFNLTAEQADRIILVSIQKAWPDVIPGKITDGRIGYTFDLYRGTTSDQVTAIAIPVDVRYKFDVWSVSITSGETDAAALNKLMYEIVDNAEIVSEFQ